MEIATAVIYTFILCFAMVAIACFYINDLGYSIYHDSEVQQNCRELADGKREQERMRVEKEAAENCCSKLREEKREIKQAYLHWCALIVAESQMENFEDNYPERLDTIQFYNKKLGAIQQMVDQEFISTVSQVEAF